LSVTRRRLAALIGALFVPRALRQLIGASQAGQATLLSAPLRLSGDWGGSPQGTARLVVSRMRDVSLSGVALLSDRQPQQLEIDGHTSGYPHVELQQKPADTAFIAVDIGTRAWAQLAYQFGHELGHVLCNSWAPGSQPKPPCQWLEEAMVEAFSLRGLGLLAEGWARDPPIAGSAAYGAAIRKYRDDQVEKYRMAGSSDPVADTAAWFHAKRDALDGLNGLYPAEGPAVVAFLAEFERDKGCIEDMGAVNRWPKRSGVPIETYLGLWQASCAEIKAPGHMPDRVRDILGLR
jgi:hypothetical protein